MIYSVWNHEAQGYDYYEGKPVAKQPFVPGHTRPKGLGLAPEEAAWPLPKGAIFRGRGHEVRGMVAHKRTFSPLSGILDDVVTDPIKLVLATLAGVWIWRRYAK